jgi:hypothetical protein
VRTIDHRSQESASVKVMRPYVLEVTFRDGFRRGVHSEPLMWGKVFEPPRDFDLFAQVTVDPIGGSVSWPTGADLAPECLSFGEVAPNGRILTERPAEVASPDPR